MPVTNIVSHETGNVKPFFQRFDQSPVFNLNVRHVTNHAAFRIDKPRQDHRDSDQFTNFTLTAINKDGDGVEQRVFQRLWVRSGSG